MDMLRLAPMLTLLVTAVLLCSAAVPGSPSPGPHDTAGVDVAAKYNNFGFNLLNAVQKTQPHENVVISPVSAALDLSMALNGASGPTAEEMKSILALPGADLGALNTANAGLIKALHAPTTGVTLYTADSLWADSRRVALRASFVDKAKRWYDAEVADVDFADKDTPARINGWVEKKTQGRIQKIIDRIGPADVALLLNALYFKGQWMHKFDPSLTKERDFTLVDGAIKKMPLMAQHGKFDYLAMKDIQAVRLPYGKGDLAMVVVLPSPATSLAGLETVLADDWDVWQSEFVQRPGDIELPRFELKGDYALNAPLQALGMRRAFEAGSAQFGGMFESAAHDSTNFFISSVRQATYLKVDEEGSEAAAVTSIGVTMTAVEQQPPPFRMIVDRPFFCAIEDLRSHALLFVGAIYDPGSSR